MKNVVFLSLLVKKKRRWVTQIHGASLTQTHLSFENANITFSSSVRPTPIATRLMCNMCKDDISEKGWGVEWTLLGIEEKTG